MRKQTDHLEKYRIRSGEYGSDESFGMCGAFLIPYQSFELRILASYDLGWEHVSVSLPNRCPNWPEMCFVKDLFWDEAEAVVQYHPPKSEYVNCHPYCLHLWKPTGATLPLPDSILVGPKKFMEKYMEAKP